MYGIYGSMVGIVNIIFTVAMCLLGIRFWIILNILVKILLIIAICLFTIIQPIVIYMRAKKQASKESHKINIGFDDSGIYIESKNQSSHLKWDMIKAIVKKPGMIIIFSSTNHGFILTDRVLEEKRNSFYDYLILKKG